MHDAFWFAGVPKMECFFSQYGVDVDGDGIADYVVGGGGNYAGYNTTGYETGYISCSLPLCFSSFTCSRLYEPISRTDAGSSLCLFSRFSFISPHPTAAVPAGVQAPPNLPAGAR